MFLIILMKRAEEGNTNDYITEIQDEAMMQGKIDRLRVLL